MYLSNLKLWNFRKFGREDEFDLNSPDLSVNFTKGLNVLIGENDSGKTAAIDAIKLVLKTHSYEWIKIVHEDFYLNTTRLRIELKFEDFKDEEAMHFTEWLGWEDDSEKAKPYLRIIYDVKRNVDDKRIYPSEVRAGVDEMGTPLSAEAKEYLKVTYLKPLRDAQFELVAKKNSRLSQILLGHEAFKEQTNNEHILLNYLKDFNEKIVNYFKGMKNNDEELSEDDQKGKKIKEKIDNFIKGFFGSNNIKSEFKITKEESLKSILEKLDLVLKNYFNPGLGTLNRLFIASELVHLQKENWNGLRLGLIEEIEAHLHPQAQLKVIETLQHQDDIQLILTTHSPNLASKVKLENLILFDDKYAFPMGKKYTKLEDKDYIFLERFLDVTKANLFFAKGVIFVEGWAEEILIPALSKKLKQQGVISKGITEAGVSVVNVGSTAFIHYSRIFCRENGNGSYINIPVAIITDIDLPELKKENGTIKQISRSKKEKNLKIKELKNKWEEQNIKVFVAPSWTLEYSLFKSTSFGNIFCEIFKEVHSGSGINNKNYQEKLGEKLLNKNLKKTEIAYRLAQKIETTDSLTIDENDESIKYLIEAIKYVCN